MHINPPSRGLLAELADLVIIFILFIITTFLATKCAAIEHIAAF